MTIVNPKMFLKRLYRRRFSLFVKFFVFFFLFSTIFLIFKSRKKDTFEMMPLKSDGPFTAEDKIYEEEIRKSEAMIVPGLGDLGEEVILEGDEKLRGDADMERIALNEYLSRKISFSRTLKDYRDPKCISVHYDTNLPSASVVIVFFNEPLTVLLRTVWSVLNTGGRYVEQVVLVDDNSSNYELKGLLDYYVRSRLHGRGVIVVRLEQRSGLIRARLAGARASRGDVLVFLDAHCECVEDWLRPLVQRIKEERRAAVVPIIDVIESKTFHYSTSGYGFQVGGFTFAGHFTWIDIGDEELTRRESDIAPTRSPTMAGGLFAMDRRYFWEVGSYDELMDGWGGENLEMSFRIWQCGGVLETIPCSRVGHVFRDFHPYSFPNDKDTHGINTARLALVWMDDYAKLFFRDRPELKDVVSQEDVAHRKVLREKLNCKSFGWFLKNVYPQKFVPGENIIGQGRFMNPAKHLCLDTLGPSSDEAFPPLGIYVCHETLGTTQHFSLTLRGELRTEEKCAQIQYKREENVLHDVIMADCHGKKKDQEWTLLLPTNQIRHVQTMLCLDVKGLQSGDHLVASSCERGSRSQMWRLEFNARNKFGALDTEFDSIDGETFGLHGDENGLLPANFSGKKKSRKGRKSSSPSVGDLNQPAEVLAKPQGFPGQFRVPAYKGLDGDKLR